jgi:MFS superfamily sulfate permease-like transporter
LFAVVLAILRFVSLVSRPKVEVLVSVNDFPGFHSIGRHKNATTIPGLLLFRFNAPIVFFNAPYFKHEVLAAADAAGPELRWFVLDMIPITMIDATGLYVAQEVMSALAERGVVWIAAGRQTEWSDWAMRRHRDRGETGIRSFPTVRAAVKAYLQESRSMSRASGM